MSNNRQIIIPIASWLPAEPNADNADTALPLSLAGPRARKTFTSPWTTAFRSPVKVGVGAPPDT
jgi:hypothetical protein